MSATADSTPAAAAKSPKKIFGVVGLAIFTFSFLANVNATPELATFGLGSIALLLGAVIFFLMPTAMASAEMGSTWPRTGGIYVWTRLAFGEAAAFMIIWLEFANFLVAWPNLMGTMTIQAAYPIDPKLANQNTFVMASAMIATWAAALLALRGLRVAKGFAWWSVLGGTILPMLLLTGFALAYLRAGHAWATPVGTEQLVPHISGGNIAYLSTALLMFSGIEISAIHSGDVQNPGRTIPRSNGIAVVLCLVFFIPLALAISLAVPAGKIDIVTGLIQAGEVMFDSFHMSWVTGVLTFLLVSGLVASLVQILGGPARGLAVAGRVGGNLPPTLQRENSQRMPVVLILGQAVISSVLCIGYQLLGSVQNAWFIFQVVQTNMTLIMYLMMFAAVVKLRFSSPDTPRPYRIPGKWFGLFGIVSLGVIVCLVGLIISLMPTVNANGMDPIEYWAVVGVGTVAFSAVPFLFWIFRKPSWRTEHEGDVEELGDDPEAVTA